MTTGSMQLKTRTGPIILAIDAAGAHPHSTSAYNAAVENLNSEKSSPSPVQGHITFLNAWISIYNAKRVSSSVQLDSFLQPVGSKIAQKAIAKQVPQVKSLQVKPNIPQVKSLTPKMQVARPAVGIGVGAVGARPGSTPGQQAQPTPAKK